MKIRISIKQGNDPADGMISTFDRLREDGIFQLTQEGK